MTSYYIDYFKLKESEKMTMFLWPSWGPPPIWQVMREGHRKKGRHVSCPSKAYSPTLGVGCIYSQMQTRQMMFREANCYIIINWKKLPEMNERNLYWKGDCLYSNTFRYRKDYEIYFFLSYRANKCVYQVAVCKINIKKINCIFT